MCRTMDCSSRISSGKLSKTQHAAMPLDSKLQTPRVYIKGANGGGPPQFSRSGVLLIGTCMPKAFPFCTLEVDFCNLVHGVSLSH